MTPMSVFLVCLLVLRKVKNRAQAASYMKMINYVIAVQVINTIYVIASRAMGHEVSLEEVVALSLPFLYVGKLELDAKKEQK